MTDRRATQPLDPAARNAANEEVYRNHADDPRPNALYDEDGNRQPLDPDDPDQADLRSEWMDSYVANGGDIEGGEETPEEDRPHGEAAESCADETEEPEPTIRVEWARNNAHTDSVIPDHNPPNGITSAGVVAGVASGDSIVEYPFEFEQADTPEGSTTEIKFVPEAECLVSPLVHLENVPDGTAASIEIFHCETNEAVNGGSLSGLEVRAGKVVRPSTGQPPTVSFRFAQDPWQSWDKPYYYFRAQVEYRGLCDETSRDFEGSPGDCLRVDYWHVCVGFTGDGIAGSVQTKCTRTNNYLTGVDHSEGVIHHFNSYNHTSAAFGSFFRNTYAVFSDSHGTLVERAGTHGNTCPNHDYSQPPDHLSQSDWKSVVCFTPEPFTGGVLVEPDPWIDAADVNNTSYFVSVPKYLYYISACLSGWDSSLADAFIQRGCRHVIAYRKVIYTNMGEQMAQRFFRDWANTHDLDPDKISDAFISSKSGLEEDLRPVLFPQSGGGSSSSGSGLSAGTVAVIVLAAVAVVAAGVLIGLAAFDVI